MASYSQFNDVSVNLPLVSCTGMTFDLSGNYLYMINNSGKSIVKFDASGDVEPFKSDANYNLQDLAFDASGFLYASNFSNNSILKFDVSSGDTSTFADTSLNTPTGLAFDDYGNLYCANVNLSVGASYIAKINASGVVTKITSGATLWYPIRLTFDNKKQYLYCSNYNYPASGTINPGNYIAKIDISGGAITNFADGSARGSDVSLNGPIGLVFDDYGNLYCANSGSYSTGSYNNSIVQISGNGVVTNFTYPSANTYSTNGLAIKNNFLYFNGNDSSSNGIVYRTDNPLLSFSALIQNANLIRVLGLTYDTSGNIYCSNTFLNNLGNITVYDSLGKYKQTIQNSSFDTPQGLAFDNSGNLYCANSGGNNILQITSPSTSSYAVKSIYTTNTAPLNLPYPVDVVYFNGYLYWIGFESNNNTSYIYKLDLSSFDASGQCIVDASLVLGPNQYILNLPLGVECDTNGNIYVANSATKSPYLIPSISKFDSDLSYNSSYLSDSLNIPHGLSFDNSSNLMIANTGDNNILQLDTSTGIFSLFADVSFSLSVLSVNKDNYLYVADYNTSYGAIYKTTTPINSLDFLTNASLVNVLGLTCDTFGNIYCSNRSTYNDNYITVYNSSGSLILTIDPSGGSTNFYIPQGLTFDNSGNLYCANSGKSSIMKITSPSTIDYSFSSVYTFSYPATYPTDVAYYNNYLYCVGFSASNDSYIYKLNLSLLDASGQYTLDASYVVFSGGGQDLSLNSPLGVECDTNGNVYVANAALYTPYTTPSIGKFNTNLNYVSSYLSDSLNIPHGLSFDNSSNLMIANTGDNNILQLNPSTGNFSVFADVDFSLSVLSVNKDNYLYVAYYATNYGIIYKTTRPVVYPVNPSFNFLIGDTLIRVLGLTYDTSGNIYCSNTLTNRDGNISVYDSSGNYKYTIISYASNGASFINIPQGLTFDDSGNLYCANSGLNSILKISFINDSSYSVSRVYSIYSPNAYPVDVAYYNNYLYCVGFNQNADSYILKLNLSILDASGNLTLDASYNASRGGSQDLSLNTPTGITCDIHGNLYVVNPALNTTLPTDTPSISKFDTSLNYIKSYLSEDLNIPLRLVFDNSGNLMIANSGADNVLQLNPNTEVFSVFGDFDFSLSALSVNKNNYLYLADYTTYGGTIYTTDEPICFNHNTKILYLNHLLEEEYIPIQDLKKGDFVKTYLHGFRRIDYIYQSLMVNNPNQWNHCMYKMEKTEENGLLEDLIVTGGHAIMVDSISEVQQERYNKIGFPNFVEKSKIDDKYLLLSSVSEEFIPLTDTNTYTIYHFCLENNGDDTARYGVWANGILTETPSKQYLVERDKYKN